MTPDSVKQHWDNPETVSMYDKLWAAQEQRLMLKFLPHEGTVLDVGCGGGEALATYAAEQRRVRFIGVDYSEQQLAKAYVRCAQLPLVSLIQMQWPTTDDPRLPKQADCVMSTRVLINIMSAMQQEEALAHMVLRVKPGGQLLLMEGSQNGHDELNAVRLALGMKPIPLARHNLFLCDRQIETWLERWGLMFCGKLGFGAFFLATRGIQPYFDPSPEWNSEFNIAAASPEFQRLFATCTTQFSRIRLWVYRKPGE
jgi:ubiquinone/menaquinone biosynthesis C-methylase UbiE